MPVSPYYLFRLVPYRKQRQNSCLEMACYTKYLFLTHRHKLTHTPLFIQTQTQFFPPLLADCTSLLQKQISTFLILGRKKNDY